MAESAKETPPSQVASHLANERTMLAYLRTALSLIGLGITVNRFGAFVRGLNKEHPTVPAVVGFDRVGIGMVALGFLLLVWSTHHFIQVSRSIDRGDYRARPMALVALSAAVFVFGVMSVVVLFSSR